MSSESDKARLLGQKRYEPSERLRAGAAFASEAAYLEFLARCRRDPASYWMELAAELSWSAKPAGYGQAGDFFPRGRLNLAQACLQGGAPDACALVIPRDGGALRLSRAELGKVVGAVIGRLTELGLAEGSPVLLAVSDGALSLVASLACLWLGLVCVPIEPGDKDAGHLQRRALGANCQAVISVEGEEIEQELELPGCVLARDWAAARAELPPSVSRSAMAPAFVLADSAGHRFSLPAAGLALQSLSAYRHLLAGKGEGDLLWLQTTVHHACFVSAWLGALLAGGGLVLPSSAELDTPERFRGALAASQARVMLVRDKKLAPLVEAFDEQVCVDAAPELLVIEGDAVRPTLYSQAHDKLFAGATHVTQVLSRPESGGFLAGHHPVTMQVLPASAGYAAPGLALGVVDARGQVCSINYGGLVALEQACPALAIELQNEPPPIRLGLRVRVDSEGLLWSMGEVKVARQESLLVSASELEAMISAIEGVDQVAVVRYEVGPGAQMTRAFVKLSGPAVLIDDIRRAVSERFGAEAVPESIQAVSNLPYSRTGKLLRSVLRRIAGGDIKGLDGESVAEDPAVIDKLVQECSDKSS